MLRLSTIEFSSVLDYWWGWLAGLAVLLVLIWIAVWITSRNRRFHRNYNSAMKLITDKHLNGEITGDEYRRLVRELENKKNKDGKRK